MNYISVKYFKPLILSYVTKIVNVKSLGVERLIIKIRFSEKKNKNNNIFSRVQIKSWVTLYIIRMIMYKYHGDKKLNEI